MPLSTKSFLKYTVAQGDGEMPVSIRVTDMTGAVIHEQKEIDHNVFSFQSLESIPGVAKHNDWALRDDDQDDGYDRVLPDGAGDDKIPYTICFEHSAGFRVPHLSLNGSPPRRRIMMELRSGTDARTMEDYERLAKEKHLSSTEKLFSVVEDRVSTVVKGIEEMRQREGRLNHVSGKTTRVVTMYSLIACASIAAGSIFSSYATYKHLVREKVF